MISPGRGKPQRGLRQTLAMSGLIVTLGFAWFATTACIDEDLDDGGGYQPTTSAPPPPPEDQGVWTADTRDDIRVRQDGTMRFERLSPDMNTGTVLCDSRTGTASSDKSAQEAMKSRLDRTVDAYRREVDAIDNLLKRCEGKAINDALYLLDRGCSEIKLGEAGTRAGSLDRQIEEARGRLRTVEGQLRVALQSISELAQSGGKDSEARIRALEQDRDRLRAEANDLRARITAAQAELGPANAEYQRLNANCNAARGALSNEPCSSSNLRYHTNRRDQVVAAGAQAKNTADQFRNCLKLAEQKRKQQENAGKPSIDAGTVIQMMPGIMGGARPRQGPGPGRSSPPPSSSGHQHSH